jgi:hypothetical protein
MTAPVVSTKVQPRRLTECHRGGANPHRGFEMMKTAGGCSGSIKNAPQRWRIVNPAGAARSSAAREELAARSASRGKKRVKTHISCG